MPPSRGACAGSATSVADKPCSGRMAWAAASGSGRRKTSAGPNNTAPTGLAHSIGDDRMHKLLQEGHAVGSGGVIKDEVRTDSASLTFFRQHIADFLSPR